MQKTADTSDRQAFTTPSSMNYSQLSPNLTATTIWRYVQSFHLSHVIKHSSLLTFLAVVGVPAAVVVVVVEHGLSALRAALHDAWTNITTLFGLLVPGDVIVELGVHDDRPVYRVQVAQLGVLFNTNGAACDVSEAVQADVLQAGHLKNYKSVVVEEISSTYDSQIWK